jgi:hypothetical protein
MIWVLVIGFVLVLAAIFDTRLAISELSDKIDDLAALTPQDLGERK